MKKVFFLLIAALLSCAGTARAQYLINQCSFTPVHIPVVTTEWQEINFDDGGRYVGAIYYSDGQFSYYSGTLYRPDGDSLYGNFGPNFQLRTDISYEMHKASDNTYWRVQFNNYGQEIRRTQYYPNTTPPVGGTYTPTNSYGGSNGSNYTNPVDNHRARCSGCNGTGSCSLCAGRGLNARGYQCSRCHGTGRCQSCAGLGTVMI